MIVTLSPATKATKARNLEIEALRLQTIPSTNQPLQHEVLSARPPPISNKVQKTEEVKAGW